MTESAKKEGRGPFRADQLKSGDRYELSDGHAVYCAPSGGDSSRANLVGASVLETDPAVEEAGVDAGYSNRPTDLRAPDVAVGNVPDRPGWIAGVPPLAVEYAGRGQSESELQAKIVDLLAQGTRYVWVVRLLGERRVEVYEPGRGMKTLRAGSRLTAPGILQNDVAVEALFDREAAHEATLRNLLQRKGYRDLEDVREQGRVRGVEQGREQGREQESRAILLDLLQARFGPLSELHQRRVNRAPIDQVRGWLKRQLTAESLEEVLGG
ncbi:MAG: Uma2 family endonuclease [Myxococcota bacterium]